MTDAPVLTVFYDGACPITRTRIALYRAEAEERGLAIAWRDVNLDAAALEPFGVDLDAARRHIHALDVDGTLAAGIDALVAIWSRLPRHRAKARLMLVPPLRAAAERLYAIGAARPGGWRFRRAAPAASGSAASGPAPSP
jgi:predicted DCC family thiol-disulfide oxidoreductase YuxK